MTQKLPSFFVVGAMKAGTTSLDAYLRQHPQIYMCPIKDGRFFCNDGAAAPRYRDPYAEHFRTAGILGWENYLELFSGARPGQVLGETTALYLYSPFAAQRIQQRFPDAKIIILLRQPASRTYSHYLQAVKTGAENLDFEAALAAEAQRIANGWGPTFHYTRRSIYVPQILEYFKRFARGNIRIYLQEDLTRFPQRTLSDIFGFIGVDPGQAIDFSKRHNIGRWPRHHHLYWWLYKPDNRYVGLLRAILPSSLKRTLGRWQRAALLGEPPPLGDIRYDELTQAFREDIVKLEALIERDLGHWLKRPLQDRRSGP